jgi:hypothetical protein
VAASEEVCLLDAPEVPQHWDGAGSIGRLYWLAGFLVGFVPDVGFSFGCYQRFNLSAVKISKCVLVGDLGIECASADFHNENKLVCICGGPWD